MMSKTYALCFLMMWLSSSWAQPMSYSQIVARNQNIKIVTEAIYFEGRGESNLGQQAIAWVIINRTHHNSFPNTPYAVITDACQFSYRCAGTELVYSDPAAYKTAQYNATLVVDGIVSDPTNGAIYYKNNKLSKQKWKKPVHISIGNHTFYGNIHKTK